MSLRAWRLVARPAVVTGCGVPSVSEGSSAAADTYVADLHIHSKYSRACSRDLTLPNLAWWARRKGIAVLGTGDFTHPAWFDHLRENLHPADEPGLFRLSPDAEQEVSRRLPPILQGTDSARFMLSVEISTIYKRDDRTRKVHHLIYLPDLDAAARFNTALGRIGNLTADGRPILGLDSRDLLEIVLEASPDGYLVPAHIWTPWFSALGSKSGFDAIADCYADLADHITAVETGLSSDPEMNWRVSSLDRYRLVSNSDAHSPAALGREATLFTGTPDYFAIKDGHTLAGTLEFFPEEGKYHADGHRACGVNWSPRQTREHGGRCPECGKPLTVGVLSRVEDLADRSGGGERPQQVVHLIQLAEILGEINGVGPKSKTVDGQLNHLVAGLGAELDILRSVPLDEIGVTGSEQLREAIGRLRRGDVRRVSGYDGEYGVITLFEPGELRNKQSAPQAETLFDLMPVPVPQQRRAEPAVGRAPVPKPAKEPKKKAPPLPPPASPHEPFEPMLAGMEEVGTGLLDRLDAMQRVAASAPGGPLLIVAGPGTGKTRTLTHRIAYLCAELGVFPERCLAITFTRRAAEEMRHRLDALMGDVAEDITVGTFHSVGLTILKENARSAGLGANWRIADDAERAAAREQAGDDDQAYTKLLRQQDLVDLDDLLTMPVALLRDEPELVERYRKRWQWVFVDEYQDVDDVQYELLRLLSPANGNLCAIGDPDQAIYSFRGADVGYFLRFSRDFTDARLVRLTRNYRSSAPILAAAVQAIAPTTLVNGRRLDPARVNPESPLVGRYFAASVADEADFVVRTIDELVGGLSHRSLDSGRIDSRAVAPGTLSFSDIAVLYRTDSQAQVVVDALSRAGVPVQKRSHNRLRDRPGVQVIARELRHADGSSGSPAARVKLTAQVLAQRYAAPTLDAEQLAPEDIWTAADLLMPLAHRIGTDLNRFLQEIATGAEVDALDPRAEAVNLLTLHAAKGLEFPVVFLVGCEDGLLPLRWPGAKPTDDETAEERRLFFVGLTRAQDRLYVSHAARRFRHGTEREQSPTPFLDAIDVGLFERMGDKVPSRPKDRQLRLL
ncbi:UvrD-helicase domain-containing protein [Actinoplanes sp. NPDC049668]|uniref:UvrD-helicase domain-containing protein n=1 Tax=Actinoplanes sp. NPDC049668 TaxID=3363904 RepID=UPI0037959DEC